jgi:hypothetical protein
LSNAFYALLYLSLFLSIFFYFLRSPVFFIKLYVNTGKSNSQLAVIIIIISLPLSQAFSPRYFLEPTGDPHRPGFNDHTAVLSELYDVPSAAVLCRESVEYLLLLLFLLTAAAVVVIVLVEVDSH